MGILNWLSIVLLFLGVIIVLLFGANPAGNATIFIWILACLLVGMFIGFLFGIPKIVQDNSPSVEKIGEPAYRQQVNSNLTEISDWLTKIIVGLGLVNLTKIPPYLSSIAKILATGISANTSRSSAVTLAFAYGIILSFSVLGFLFGYITTRIYLASAFSEADQKALHILAQKAEETAGAAQSALQKAEFALIKTSDSYKRKNQSPEEGLEELIEKYDQIRNSFPSSDAKTNKMAEVTKEMMNIVPLVTSFDISSALAANDNGKRLAAYAYLYMKPDIKYLDTLVDTIIKEQTAFGQYWGIQAIGKVINNQPESQIATEIFDKLKTFYNELEKGTNRAYELRKLLHM